MLKAALAKLIKCQKFFLLVFFGVSGTDRTQFLIPVKNVSNDEYSPDAN